MIKDWTAAPYNLATIYMILAHQKQKQALTQQACYQHFRKAFLAIEAEMKRLVETHGLLHQDMNMCNVLFSNDLTKVVFIDWGLYSNHTVCTTIWTSNFLDIASLTTYIVSGLGRYG